MQNPKRAQSQKPYSLTNHKPPIYLLGALFGKPDDMVFEPSRDYTFCRICGTIYQPDLNRVPSAEYTPAIQLAAMRLRQEWSHNHARYHTDTEHRQLRQSGRALTPEAQHRLAAYGVCSLTDLTFSDENIAAGLEAPRMPHNDVEV
jgi:hypothetical protein